MYKYNFSRAVWQCVLRFSQISLPFDQLFSLENRGIGNDFIKFYHCIITIIQKVGHNLNMQNEEAIK